MALTIFASSSTFYMTAILYFRWEYELIRKVL